MKKMVVLLTAFGCVLQARADSFKVVNNSDTRVKISASFSTSVCGTLFVFLDPGRELDQKRGYCYLSILKATPVDKDSGWYRYQEGFVQNEKGGWEKKLTTPFQIRGGDSDFILENITGKDAIYKAAGGSLMTSKTFTVTGTKDNLSLNPIN